MLIFAKLTSIHCTYNQNNMHRIYSQSAAAVTIFFFYFILTRLGPGCWLLLMAWPPMLREPKQKRILFPFVPFSLMFYFINLPHEGGPLAGPWLPYRRRGDPGRDFWGTLVSWQGRFFFSMLWYRVLSGVYQILCTNKNEQNERGKNVCVPVATVLPAYRLEPPQSVNEQTMKGFETTNNNVMIITSTHTCHEERESFCVCVFSTFL
jgi:hypothetical protein